MATSTISGGGNSAGLSGFTTVLRSETAMKLNDDGGVPGRSPCRTPSKRLGLSLCARSSTSPCHPNAAMPRAPKHPTPVLRIDADLDSGSDDVRERLSTMDDGDDVLNLTATMLGDPTFADFPLFPGDLADPRPTGSVTAGGPRIIR